MTYISSMQRIGIIVLLLVLFSCRKESTTWNTSNSAPLLNTSLDIYDLLADSLLVSGEDDVVSIFYSNEVFNFGIDSLVEVREDTIENSFNIFPITKLDVVPGQQFYNQSELLSFDQVDALLNRAIIKTGNMALNASSSIQGDIIFRVTIPEAKRNGVSFEYEGIIPAGNLNTPGILMESTAMDGYDLNLTGENGSDYNEIEVIYSLTVPDYEDVVTIFAANEVSMEIIFSGLEVEFVQGYLGTDEFEFDEKSYFENIPELNEALVNLSEAKLDLSISNGFGVDLQAIIYDIEAENSGSVEQIQLEHSLIGSTVNLPRAGISQEMPIPSEKNYIIDQTNSNIVELLEIIPDSIRISGRADLNPFGNISNYNDFASEASEFKCNAQVEIPLRASFSNLALLDTSEIQWSNDDLEISQTIFYLHTISTFQADAEISIILAEESGNQLMNLTDRILDDVDPRISGSVDGAPGITTLAFELNSDDISKLEKSSWIITELRFETTNYPELVEIRSTDKIDILISADINAQLQLE